MRSHLFAHCSAAVCVAEDSSVGFYAPKSLRKFRTEAYSDHRVVGISITASEASTLLHVMDSAGVYSQVDIGAGFAVKATNRLVLSEGKKSRATRRAAAKMVESDDRLVSEAHFYVAPSNTSDGCVVQGALRCVVLTQGTLLDVDPIATETSSSTVQLPCAPAQVDPLVAVGSQSGVVAVSAVGASALSIVAFSARRDVSRRTLGKLQVASIAVSGFDSAVAVGGARGELAVFPSADSPTCFSDHWHHTRLTALCFSSDGHALFTGAAESVLLQWSMRDFSFRKIGCSLGPIRAAVPSPSQPNVILVPCADSTLATVDTLQQRVVGSCEGVAWTSGECTGMVVASWMGQPAVVLTGMPEVVCVCDPLTRQALYSLHVTHQMETVAALPRCGITSVALLDEGRTIVTYEQYFQRALPSSLRFWSSSPATASSKVQHVEKQKIHSPHDDPVIAMLPDSKNQRVFSLSSTVVKCWSQMPVSSDVGGVEDRWGCVSFCSAPSRAVAAMALSVDGSTLMVADDVVHVYGVSSLRPGVPWARLLVLSQAVTASPLRSLVLLEQSRAVAAFTDDGVFVWPLQSHRRPQHTAFKAPPTAICAFTATTLLVGLQSGDVVEFEALSGKTLSTRPAHGVPKYLSCINIGSSSVAMLDASNSLRCLSVLPNKLSVEIVRVQPAAHAAGGAQVAALSTYFRPLEAAAGDTERDEEEATRSANAAQKSKQWLDQVLGSDGYTAPSMSTVLSSYLAATS
jgi:NET1-associated nuclear protein 1 (U3 small nucleolar RNA-associated protein 17)